MLQLLSLTMIVRRGPLTQYGVQGCHPTPTRGRSIERYGLGVSQRTVDHASAAILTAARELLAEEGPRALTVRRIASAAGGSTMNVYSRFGGKDGVVDALLVEGFEELGEALRAVPTTDDTISDLQQCSRAYRDFAVTHRAHYELMFGRRTPGFTKSEKAVDPARVALGMLVDRIKRAMDAGELRASDPFDAATVFWSACHGPVSLEIEAVGPPDTDWASVHRQLFAALIAGLRTAPLP